MFKLPGAMYYDRKSQPIDLMTWAAKVEDREYAVIAQHWIRGWMVSTVWMGLNHNFLRDGPPVIFETMVFPPGDESDDGGMHSESYQDRYATEEAAQAGHDQALAWVVEKLGPDSVADIMGPLMEGTSDDIPDWEVP